MAFLPGEPIAREIPLLFFFPPGAETGRACQGDTGFRCEDQSRIAGVCREIRCLAALELMLCSSSAAGRILFVRPARELARRSNSLRCDKVYCAAHSAITLWSLSCAISQVPASPT